MSSLVIWGAGGHGQVVLDVAHSDGRFEKIAFADDTRTGTFYGLPVFESKSSAIVQFDQFVIAIGDNESRARCYIFARQLNLPAATLIHPSAIVSPSAKVGPGTVIMPRAVINAGAHIGENCIINTGAIIEHDCCVGDHAHISPGAVLGGGAAVGAYSHLGISASVLPLISIGSHSIIGAGTVVLSPIPDSVTAVGVPARIVKRVA